MEQSVHELIARVLAGEAGTEGIAQLEQMCAADAEIAQVYEEAQHLWQMADGIQPRIKVDVPAAWQRVYDRIQLPEILTPEVFMAPVEAPSAARRIAFPAWARWAAAATVLGIGLIWNFSQNRGAEMQTYTAATQGARVSLADGSEVILGKGATLRYPKKFTAANREVSLEGVAFFEVAKDPQHPFIVDADPIQVKVLGTSFLVDDSHSKVSVKTGSVQVEAVKNARTVALTPGQSAEWRGKEFVAKAANLNDFYLESGEIRIEGLTLDRTVSEISRILGVPVQLDVSVDAAGRSQLVTFTTDATDAGSVLTDLCRITGYLWEKDNSGGYRIYRAQ